MFSIYSLIGCHLHVSSSKNSVVFNYFIIFLTFWIFGIYSIIGCHFHDSGIKNSFMLKYIYICIFKILFCLHIHTFIFFCLQLCLHIFIFVVCAAFCIYVSDICSSNMLNILDPLKIIIFF